VRIVLSVILILCGSVFNELHSTVKFNDTFISGFFLPQQEPFYFQKSIPATVRLRGKIDLSFFRNQSIVSQYRFKLVLPAEGETVIDRSLTKWSAWISFNFIEILIPVLDLEGGYKLIIEYRPSKREDISKFEKPFYVYRANAMTGAVVAESKSASESDKPVDKTDLKPVNTVKQTVSETDKPDAKTVSAIERPATNISSRSTKAATRTLPDADKVTIEKITINQKQISIVNLEIKGIDASKITSQAGNNTTEPSIGREAVESINSPDYNKMLAESIEKKNVVLFRKSIQNGAGSGVKGADGGNIFHLIDNTLADEQTISLLVRDGISINETDNYGNSPINSAILSGNNEYARMLINQGADLNSRNMLGLSPLHIAAFLNNETVVNQLLLKGADINMKGNSGYTPLHIAAEMNHLSLVKDLFSMGADRRIKTDQKLTPKAIAKIQGNYEMVRLIGKKGSYDVNVQKPDSTNNSVLLNSAKLNPKYDFKLPFDQELAKKRQFNKVIQTISIPIFAISTAGMAYFKSESNNYYSLSKIAETEEMARDFYNKGNMYNTYSYISGGISLVSVYGFIHSTIRKKNISLKMRKRLD